MEVLFHQTIEYSFISIYTPPSTPNIFPLDPPGTATGSVYFNNLLWLLLGLITVFILLNPPPINSPIWATGLQAFHFKAHLYEQGGNIFVDDD
ncbi:MAG: hypothetical protein R2788_17990 [Saprospiraceae bacterium]